MIVDERDYPALREIDPPGAYTTSMRFSTGYTDWRAIYGSSEPAQEPIIDLQPYVEMVYGEPFTVWRLPGARSPC